MSESATTYATILRQDLVLVGDPASRILQLIEAPNATIAVPGCPAVWKPARFKQKLPQDSGWIFSAQNAARLPQHPIEPIFRALRIEQPDADYSDVDIISDRNNIRKLLSFVDPGSSQRGLEAFTIKAELIGQTVVLNRDEVKAKEYLGPSDFRGFGHEFEKAYTQEELEGSTGHHRHTSYNFQDLKMMIRFETDGYVRADAAHDDLDSLLSKLNISSASSSKQVRPVIKSHKPTGSALTIRSTGREVPQQSILEIKTRVKHKPLEWSETAPQLWVSQTPNLVVAYHQRGVFEVPEVKNVSTRLFEWGTANQINLRKLAVLLKKIVAQVKIDKKAVIRYQESTGTLSIMKTRHAASLIPEDLITAWTTTTHAASRSEESCNEYQDKAQSPDESTVASKRADSPVSLRTSLIDGPTKATGASG